MTTIETRPVAAPLDPVALRADFPILDQEVEWAAKVTWINPR